MKNKEKDTNLIIILLVVIIFILVIGMAFLFYRYEKLENKYDKRLESGYFYDFDDMLDYNHHEEDDHYEDDHKTTSKPTGIANYISREKALSVALKDMKLSTADVYDIEVEFENKTTHGNYVYEVSFEYQNYEYEYFIDAKTGKIITSFKSRD